MSEIPPTSFMRDGIREMILRQNDPTTSGYDIATGVEERDTAMRNITHEMLSETLPDYIEKEAQIAETMGEDFTRYLLGIGSFDPTIPTVEPPLVRIDIPASGYLYEPVMATADLVGGNMVEDDFVFEWFATIGSDNVVIDPNEGRVVYSEYDAVGTFAIRCRATSERYGLLIFTDGYINISEREPSSSSSS